MLTRVLAILLTTASLAHAEELPALFDVTGVASDDVLNVRTRPMAQANIIGTLAYNAQNIEVVEIDNGWGRVNVPDGSGWASMKFLTLQDGTAMPEAQNIGCFGTEPFWSLDIAQGGEAVLSTPEGADRGFVVGKLHTAAARPEPYAMLGRGSGENIAIHISKEICSDGMSDDLFGLEGTVIIGGYGVEVLSGCCTIQGN